MPMDAPAQLSGKRLFAMGLAALWMTMPVTLPVAVLPGLVKERFEVSVFLTSLFMAINMVGAVVTAPLAGAISDRIGSRRKLITVALLLDAALFVALTLPLPFWAFLAVRLLEGAAHIFALSLLLATAAELAPEQRRGRTMGMLGAGITLGVAIGAPLGGVIGKVDPLRNLWVGGGLILCAAALSWFSVLDGRPAQDRASFRRIWKAIRADRALGAPLAFAFTDRFTVGFFVSCFPLYLKQVLKQEPGQVGLLLALFLMPFALLSYPFGRLSERMSRAAMVSTGSLIYGGLVFSLGWWPVAQLPILMVLLGLSSAVMFVPSLVMTTEIAGPEIRGTAMGAFNAAGSLGFLVGPIVAGSVADAVGQATTWDTGYTTSFAVAGTSEIACVLLTLPVILRMTRSGRTT